MIGHGGSPASTFVRYAVPIAGRLAERIENSSASRRQNSKRLIRVCGVALALAGCGTATPSATLTKAAQTSTTLTTTTAPAPRHRRRHHIRPHPVATITTATVTATSTVQTTTAAAPQTPDPALCQSLYNQWVADGRVSDPAIQEYGQIGCGLSQQQSPNNWCKTLTASDGSLVRVCDFRPNTPGASPP